MNRASFRDYKNIRHVFHCLVVAFRGDFRKNIQRGQSNSGPRGVYGLLIVFAD
jgi:hypothetical protein